MVTHVHIVVFQLNITELTIREPIICNLRRMKYIKILVAIDSYGHLTEHQWTVIFQWLIVVGVLDIVHKIGRF
jgi:hypothetical protein